ncbi:MAG: hypothetical protein E3K37_09785 [Candidatus Kuenenia sp.]|nr:hypothetical protein [Candidatus Kuenenia hertensis]
MKLSRNDEEFITNISEILEEKQRSGVISTNDISPEEVQRLLASTSPDLAMVGSYILSLLPYESVVSTIKKDSVSARNYARFLIAEKPSPQAENIVKEDSSKYPFLLNHYKELSSRLMPSVHKAAKAVPKQEMTMIIHGTWAATSTWWQEGGNFWNYINGITGNVYGGKDVFSWSGANKHKDRIKAAHHLIDWINTHPCTHLDIIAHSHGGNVCLFATRLGLKIRKLITLGTPVRLEYLPDLRNIEILYNVFSTRDLVQTPAGTFPNRRAEGRTFGDGRSVINLRAEDDGHGGQPGHSELHEPDTWKACGLNKIL